jgi:hypothetical protein
MTLTTRLAHLAAAREQAAYRRRVAAFGLPALLAPYRVRAPFVPKQRKP